MAYDKNISCPYGKPIIIFCYKWADLIEEKKAKYPKIEFGIIADAMVKRADKTAGGISGFQYGCAVKLLSEVWIHGEELRRWHNLKTQIHSEGVEANEFGGVLNPAIINIGSQD